MSQNAQTDSNSTIVSWARFVALGLEAVGVDSPALFLEAGIDSDQLKNPNERLPVSQMTRLWELAVEATGDPCFPLSLATRAQADIFNALGLSISLSSTMGEALQKLCRYSRIASDAAVISLADGPDQTIDLIYELQVEVAGEAMEAFMATGHRIIQQIYQADFSPLEVHFRHDKSDYLDRYESFFQAKVLFGAPAYKFVLHKEILDKRCHHGNPDLAASIDRWMTDYLDNLDDKLLSVKVQRLLARKLSDGMLDQAQVADYLAMSTRALQRGLQKEGKSFKELLDTTRHDLALKYLSEPRTSLIEICLLLGFSDQSNFTRAFKRWTGKTPAAYRKMR